LKEDVALALLDIQMPEMDGFELAELMRGSERTRRVPIIFLTAGVTDRQRRFRGYEAGAVDFLEKPLEPDILRSKVAVFAELYLQRQQISVQRDNLKAFAEENLRLLKESRRYANALKEADRRKDEFLATLAHELRNPLAPIRNGLQILKLSPDSERGDVVRDMMDRQLNHLVRLIDDLLDVSRVSRGKIELRLERIAVQDAVRAALEASRPLIDAGGHDLSVDMPDESLWVEGDLTRLAQVMSNLLNNAAKYTPEGGRIALTLRDAGPGWLEIAVTDSGVGIEADMLPKVFELFTQVDQNLDRSQGGLGIGLALVKKLVEMHGGEVRAVSPGAGQGSTFTLRLPRAAAPDDAGSRRTDTDETTRPLDVLIVDDNVDSAQTTRWMLEMMGHRTRMENSGPAALAAAAEHRPDVVLLDIGMPGMDGYEVCRQLRAMPGFDKTLVIAQTGWGQESDRRRAFDAGFDHHITKPVSLDLLAQALGDYGEKRDAPDK
ncbi:MAG: response regulator, partial [Asticcacaulis sp.]|nr:response regulator [Asticcacaulis sp.]